MGCCRRREPAQVAGYREHVFCGWGFTIFLDCLFFSLKQGSLASPAALLRCRRREPAQIAGSLLRATRGPPRAVAAGLPSMVVCRTVLVDRCGAPPPTAVGALRARFIFFVNVACACMLGCRTVILVQIVRRPPRQRGVILPVV